MRCGGLMRRQLAVALFVGLVVAMPSRGLDEKKGLVLEVLVPEDDATVSVNGKTIEGEGKKRRIEVATAPEGKDHHLVTAVWEPNNYTKFTRTRKVPAKSRGTVTVDLTKAYDQEKIVI